MREVERAMGAERRRGGSGHPGRSSSGSIYLPSKDAGVADRTPRLGEPGERNDRVCRVGAAHLGAHRFLPLLCAGHADGDDPEVVIL